MIYDEFIPSPLLPLCIRHPTASQRPSPSDLLKELTRSNESSLLQWSEDDRLCHPQASTLGAPLKAGKLLYSELQQTYL